MTSTGLLILSNLKNIEFALRNVREHVKQLYIHLNIPKSTEQVAASSWSNLIHEIYSDCNKSTPNIDVRVLISPLKNCVQKSYKNDIQMIFSDVNYPEINEMIKQRYHFDGNPIFLKPCFEMDLESFKENKNRNAPFETVVVGGTFDRFHVGHKILLTEGVLMATKKLVVGVTDNEMVKAKVLPELVLPVEERINDVKDFLNDIDSSLEYDVVAISDPYGPTKTDPNMNMIVVSSETFRGGQKVNEIRKKNKLEPLEICCVNLIRDCHYRADNIKVSSSTIRKRLLGTRINDVIPRPNLPQHPYIIGLTGGIASGKTHMGKVLKKLGATVFDCDKIAHELYEPGQICYDEIVKYFGEEILTSTREIDRTKLGPIVFENPEKLEVLNNIVWPALLKEVKKRIAEISNNPQNKVVVIEAAVLFKANWESECHEIWSLIVKRKTAVKRLMERNNLTEEDAEKRLAVQVDNETMVAKSNIIFSSEWDFKFTQKQVEKAWKIITEEIDENYPNKL